MSKNNLIIAAAGSGKTSYIVRHALDIKTERILITTFTDANEASIKDRLIKANGGAIPTNIEVQTWFSFLLQHFVRPYRFWSKRDAGLLLVNGQSGLKYYNADGKPVYWGESDFCKYYFDSRMRVYSDKLAKLSYRCNRNSDASVIKRLQNIYGYIYIDEVQDMAGWDLEIIKLLMKSSIILTLVGDPRQAVYETHHDKKYNSYGNGRIDSFILDKCKSLRCCIDKTSLAFSYRNAADICSFASGLYPEYDSVSSKQIRTCTHIGLFLVKNRDVFDYCATYNPMQLRHSKKTEVRNGFETMNFGDSKGLERDHIIIYPTQPMLDYLCGKGKRKLSSDARARLYVAVTRAFFSVAVVVPDNFNQSLPNFHEWSVTDAVKEA